MRCDGISDCRDGRDEKNCEKNRKTRLRRQDYDGYDLDLDYSLFGDYDGYDLSNYGYDPNMLFTTAASFLDLDLETEGLPFAVTTGFPLVLVKNYSLQHCFKIVLNSYSMKNLKFFQFSENLGVLFNFLGFLKAFYDLHAFFFIF